MFRWEDTKRILKNFFLVRHRDIGRELRIFDARGCMAHNLILEGTGTVVDHGPLSKFRKKSLCHPQLPFYKVMMDDGKEKLIPDYEILDKGEYLEYIH